MAELFKTPLESPAGPEESRVIAPADIADTGAAPLDASMETIVAPLEEREVTPPSEPEESPAARMTGALPEVEPAAAAVLTGMEDVPETPEAEPAVPAPSGEETFEWRVELESPEPSTELKAPPPALPVASELALVEPTPVTAELLDAVAELEAPPDSANDFEWVDHKAETQPAPADALPQPAIAGLEEHPEQITPEPAPVSPPAIESAAPPPPVHAAPAPVGDADAAAEQIVDRVLHRIVDRVLDRIRPELIAEVKRLLG
jgi:hypothetical protein